MILSTLFDNCIDTIITRDNPIYYIGDKINNTSLVLSFDVNINKLYTYADEWLYLLKEKYSLEHTYYKELINTYNNINTSDNIDISFCNEKVIPFITSFSTGTSHGYSGIVYILNEYVNNMDKYKDYKIIIYNGSQQGIIDFIYHFVNKGLIPKEKVIQITSKKKYLFKSIKFIPNKWHMYPFNPNLKIKILDDHVFMENKILTPNDNICIIKNSKSQNITSQGIFPRENVIRFCNQTGLTLVEPSSMNEIKLINTIFNSSMFIASWGTSFFKNYIYISDKCKQIIVLVFKGNFDKQYIERKQTGNLRTKYKNASISYHIIDEMLNIDF